MKILVIDDTQANLDAAKQTIEGHDLTLASSYDEAYKLLDKSRSPFDVVLCDLLMPAGREQQGNKGMEYIGQEMPVGWALALMAVLQGAKYTAVVTNLDHHSHPAAAMLDRLGSDGLSERREDEFVKIYANGVPIGFVNYAPMIPVEGTTCPDCGGSGKQEEGSCWICKGSRKNENTGETCGSCEGSGRNTCYSCSRGKLKGKDWGRVLQVLLKCETRKET